MTPQGQAPQRPFPGPGSAPGPPARGAPPLGSHLHTHPGPPWAADSPHFGHGSQRRLACTRTPDCGWGRGLRFGQGSLCYPGEQSQAWGMSAAGKALGCTLCGPPGVTNSLLPVKVLPVNIFLKSQPGECPQGGVTGLLFWD